MGINPSRSARSARPTHRPTRVLLLCLLGLVLGLTVGSCTSIRPVIKIGLVAPFEGLHRQRGYAALAAMRQAITDFAPDNVAIMPLAVDDTADPDGVKRTVRKLQQDQAVLALVGPYDLMLAQALQTEGNVVALPWLVPFVLDPAQGFVPLDDAGDWVLPLVVAAAEEARRQGATRLLIAGWPSALAAPTSQPVAIPVLVSNELVTVEPQDAILWIGPTERGATTLTAVRNRLPNVPMVLGPQVDLPIFSELVQISGPVYYLFWLDDGYAQWRLQQATALPTDYLTYRATAQAIATTLGRPLPGAPSWRVGIESLNGAGSP